MTNIFPCYARRQRSGITLIEVVASMFLMSTLLVGILMSFARHQRQLNRVEDQQRANAAINLLLYEWFESESGFPTGQSGPCKSDPDFFWSTSVVGQFRFANRLDAVTVRVSVFAVNRPGKPLVSVDLVDRVDRVDRVRDPIAAAGGPR